MNVCNCGCKLTKDSGSIMSKLPQSKNFCHWVIKTQPGSSIVLSINRIDNFDWTNGGVYIAAKERVHKFTEQLGDSQAMRYHQFPIVIRSQSNLMNVTLNYRRLANVSRSVEMEASYITKRGNLISPMDSAGFLIYEKIAVLWSDILLITGLIPVLISHVALSENQLH